MWKRQRSGYDPIGNRTNANAFQTPILCEWFPLRFYFKNWNIPPASHRTGKKILLPSLSLSRTRFSTISFLQFPLLCRSTSQWSVLLHVYPSKALVIIGLDQMPDPLVPYVALCGYYSISLALDGAADQEPEPTLHTESITGPKTIDLNTRFESGLIGGSIFKLNWWNWPASVGPRKDFAGNVLHGKFH